MRDDIQTKQTGWSTCEIDGNVFTEQITVVINAMNLEGYEVVSVTPIISGAYSYMEINSSRAGIENRQEIHGGGYGYGYSHTEGMVIVGRKQK